MSEYIIRKLDEGISFNELTRVWRGAGKTGKSFADKLNKEEKDFQTANKKLMKSSIAKKQFGQNVNLMFRKIYKFTTRAEMMHALELVLRDTAQLKGNYRRIVYGYDGESASGHYVMRVDVSAGPLVVPDDIQPMPILEMID